MQADFQILNKNISFHDKELSKAKFYMYKKKKKNVRSNLLKKKKKNRIYRNFISICFNANVNALFLCFSRHFQNTILRLYLIRIIHTAWRE